MKKLAMVASLIAVCGSFGVAQAASTGIISFSGELTDTTCNVAVNGSGADATVVLPTISTSQLNATGTAGRTSFTLSLSGCAGALTKAATYFQAGPSVNATTGRLINTSGTATQVSLQLRDGSDPTSQKVILAGDTSQVNGTTYLPISPAATTVLPYSVEYFAEGNAATSGTVISSVVYSLQYK